MKLTVVGNGVAGSALTRAARSRGHDVTLISAGKPAASLAALAVLRPSYVSAADAREAIRTAVEDYTAAGCEIIRGAVVTSTNGEERTDPDWWAIGKLGMYLVPADEPGTLDEEWTDRRSDITIHATGPTQGGKHTFGVTWASADPNALRFPGLRVHRWAPYRTVDGVKYSDSCRLGSSAATTQEAAREQAIRQFHLAQDLGWLHNKRDWVMLSGIRVDAERLAEQTGPGRWRFGGFHRLGWALAPLRARQLLDELELAV